MSCKNFKVGDRVRFRGTADETGRMTSAYEDGDAVFEATIANKPYGICYGLVWDNGDPIGLPFHDSQLELVQKKTRKR